MRGIVVADGDVRDGPALRRALHTQSGNGNPGSATLVVAADGGALKAEQLGLRPRVVVGDGDSLRAERVAQLREDGVEVIVHPLAKDESDTELAVREAVLRGATSVVLVGAFGGERLDHSVANLLLLTMPELYGLNVSLVDGPSEVRVIGRSGPAELRLVGAAGDYVSLLPLSERVEGVETSGLRFPLRGEALSQGPTRGLSNELVADEAWVRTRSGRLAVIHTSRQGLTSSA